MRLICMLGVLVVASFAVADEATDKDIKDLQGKWKVVSLEADGKKAPEKVLENVAWIIEGKEIVFGGPKETKASFTIDPSKSPKEIDLTALDGEQKGRTFLGIYELKDGKLRFCLRDKPEKGRPTEFKSEAGGGTGVIGLERAKE